MSYPDYSAITQQVAANKAFGMHLMLDIANCDPTVLADANALHKILRDIPDSINMTRICDTQVTEYAGNDDKDPGGYSGFVLLAESHFSFHTFPAKNYISLDLYSCAPFDTTPLIKNIQNIFKAEITDIQSQCILRGQHYPLD